MPDIIGWSSSEDKTLARILELEIELDGYGYVKEQSLKKNTVVTKGMKLSLKLEEKAI